MKKLLTFLVIIGFCGLSSADTINDRNFGVGYISNTYVPYSGATSNVNLGTKNLITSGDVATTSVSIGANSLTTAEWANLDGVNQTLATTSSPAFANILSGTYTPTLTNTTNISASTAFVCQYMRVGNVVTVSGHVNIDVTTGGSDAILGMSLPIASTFAASGQAGGVATTDGSQDLFTIYADAANARVSFYSKANALTANSAYSFTFTYLIV